MDACQQDAVFLARHSARGHGNVHGAPHLEHIGTVGAVEQAEASGAVGNRAGRLEGAVPVDADQQDAVVEVCSCIRPDHGNVRGSAHFERVGGAGAVEPRKAAGAAVC